MQTFNSFDALATASTTPLQSDMSVFNANVPSSCTVAEALHWERKACVDFARDLLEDANVHGAVYLLNLYKKKGYPTSTEVEAQVKW